MLSPRFAYSPAAHSAYRLHFCARTLLRMPPRIGFDDIRTIDDAGTNVGFAQDSCDLGQGGTCALGADCSLLCQELADSDTRKRQEDSETCFGRTLAAATVCE